MRIKWMFALWRFVEQYSIFFNFLAVGDSNTVIFILLIDLLQHDSVLYSRYIIIFKFQKFPHFK